MVHGCCMACVYLLQQQHRLMSCSDKHHTQMFCFCVPAVQVQGPLHSMLPLRPKVSSVPCTLAPLAKCLVTMHLTISHVLKLLA